MVKKQGDRITVRNGSNMVFLMSNGNVFGGKVTSANGELVVRVGDMGYLVGFVMYKRKNMYTAQLYYNKVII